MLCCNNFNANTKHLSILSVNLDCVCLCVTQSHANQWSALYITIYQLPI